MPTRPMISVAATTGLTEAIVAAGGRPETILRSVGLDRSSIASLHGFIPCAAFTRLLEEAATSTGDACFGLHYGEHFCPKNMGPLAYVALNSPTFAAGFENIVRYHRVHNEGIHVSFAIEGKWAYVRQRLTDPAVDPPRQHNEFSAAVGLNMMRLMAGSRWAPAEVHFAHPEPGDTSEYLRVFAAPVLFGHATNAFVIEREFAERRVPAADEQLYPILKRYLDRALKEMPREDGLLASVRKAIAESMRDGDPALPRVAGTLAMSPRTLQRRLAEHATDFKRLVDDTRRRFSIIYLKDPKHTLTEIAYMLGYSEVSAFNRAFKRWTASTPSDYRRKATP